MYGICFPIYYMTIALAVALSSPTAEIAGLMFSLLFFICPYIVSVSAGAYQWYS